MITQTFVLFLIPFVMNGHSCNQRQTKSQRYQYTGTVMGQKRQKRPNLMQGVTLLPSPPFPPALPPPLPSIFAAKRSEGLDDATMVRLIKRIVASGRRR